MTTENGTCVFRGGLSGSRISVEDPCSDRIQSLTVPKGTAVNPYSLLSEGAPALTNLPRPEGRDQGLQRLVRRGQAERPDRCHPQERVGPFTRLSVHPMAGPGRRTRRPGGRGPVRRPGPLGRVQPPDDLPASPQAVSERVERVIVGVANVDRLLSERSRPRHRQLAGEVRVARTACRPRRRPRSPGARQPPARRSTQPLLGR